MNQPIIKEKSGNVSVAVFGTERKDKAGKTFMSYSAQLQISYLDKDGKWVNNSLTIVSKNISDVLLTLGRVNIALNSPKSLKVEGGLQADFIADGPE
jgi:hypothetical protein